jgi:hypothetical protein
VLVILVDRDAGLVARHPGWRDRLGARLHAWRLDRELAEGASPDASMALALRAQCLVRDSVRNDLAHSVEHILDEADAAVTRRGRPLPTPLGMRVGEFLCADRVIAAAKELRAVAERLRRPGPVAAQGVARIALLVRDGTGPLYFRSNHDDLRAALAQAVEALDPVATP